MAMGIRKHSTGSVSGQVMRIAQVAPLVADPWVTVGMMSLANSPRVLPNQYRPSGPPETFPGLLCAMPAALAFI